MGAYSPVATRHRARSARAGDGQRAAVGLLRSTLWAGGRTSSRLGCAGSGRGPPPPSPGPPAGGTAPCAPEAFPPQTPAPHEGDGSCRCDFGVVHPVLGLGKRPFPRGGAHPSCLPPHAKPPPPHGSRQCRLRAGAMPSSTDRSPTPATASRHRLAPNGPLVQLIARFRWTEAGPGPVTAPTLGGSNAALFPLP